jgi:hypothetical protein
MEFYQNKCHLGNAPDTRRPCVKATDVWAQWVADRPNSLAGRPHLQLPMSFLGGDALQEAVEGNPRPGVGGGSAPWPAGHVARPAVQHLVSYQLHTPHSSCSSTLIKVLV